MKLKRGDSIRVTWVDACGTAGWQQPYTDGVEVVNTGVFVLENKNGLCIAKGITDDPDDDVLDPGFIPAGMIRKIKKLR